MGTFSRSATQRTALVIAAAVLVSLPERHLAAQTAASPQTGAQVTTPPPRPSAPPPVGLPGQFASWLQLRGEFRGRLEGFDGGAFRPDNRDGYMLDRFRLNATVAPSKTAKFVVQVQDARVFDKTTGGSAVPFRDTLDLRMAYGEFGGARNMVRAGRQELAFGEQRLIGHLNWVNDARSFDGVRATIARKAFKFDAFATSVVTIQPDGFDKSGNGNRLYGFYGSAPTFDSERDGRAVSVLAAVGRADARDRRSRRHSPGHDRHAGGREAAGAISTTAWRWRRRRDRSGPTTLRAWAGHWVVGKTFAGAAGKPRPFGEFNYASGDSDPKDGVRGTFDQLYPTGHDKLGLADQVGWRNVDHLRGGHRAEAARAVGAERQLSRVLARERDRCALRRERRRRGPIGSRHGRPLRRPGARRAGGLHLFAAAPDRRRLRPRRCRASF